jgi:hypothetical protein
VDKIIGEAYHLMTCMPRFAQYLDNTTKRLFSSRPTTLLWISSFPILLDMNTFQFKVSTDIDAWTNPADFKSFDTDTYRTRTHPVFLFPFKDMDPKQNVNDDEFRALAVSFLEDIETSRNVMPEENIRDLVHDFGFFNAKGDNIEESLHHSKIREYVRERFMVLCAIGFREAMSEMDSKEDAQEEAAEKESDGEPSTTRMRRTQPDVHVHDANTACFKGLEDVDDVGMFLCAFEDFSERADIRSLLRKVALLLTDPPYNTRRETGASKYDYDKLSLFTMKEAVDVFENLLRPHGHAFIFYSFKQATEWRSVLESAGGWSSLKLPEVPEMIIRNNTAIHSAGIFLYHRVNAYETAFNA